MYVFIHSYKNISQGITTKDQEKKAGTPNAELVKDFSLEKEVRDVTSDTDNNKVVENDKRLMDQELSDPEDDLKIETGMDRTKPNPQVGHFALADFCQNPNIT